MFDFLSPKKKEEKGEVPVEVDNSLPTKEEPVQEGFFKKDQYGTDKSGTVLSSGTLNKVVDEKLKNPDEWREQA